MQYIRSKYIPQIAVILSVQNPTRRNRNIGTAKQGLGQNNKLTIATPYGELKSFYERLESYTKETRIINGREFVFVIEKKRNNSTHPCSINDIEEIIKHLPIEDYGYLKLIVLRQPKRKEEIISPVWGRLIYSYEFEDNFYPAIILDAIDLTKKLKWDKTLSNEDQKEIERLKEDGHKFEETKRAFIVAFNAESSRNTQLYRTLPHEFGHYVHYLELVEWPGSETEAFEEKEKRENLYFSMSKNEKEQFAHRYAAHFRTRLIKARVIPFDPL